MNRLLRLTCILAAPLLLAGCLGPLSYFLEGTGPSNMPARFDQSRVPPSIRSDVARIFPDYAIVDAILGDEDVELTLRHRTREFFMTQQWDRVSKPGEWPVRWAHTGPDLDGFDLANAANPRGRTFVDFFTGLYPDGKYIFDGMVDYSSRGSVEYYEANLFPKRSTPVAPGLYSAHAVVEEYKFDTATGEWSVR